VGDLDLAPLPHDACNPPAHYMPDRLWEAVHGNTEILTLPFGTIIGGAVFGGVHCVAWNFQFPTTMERLLWRVRINSYKRLAAYLDTFQLLLDKDQCSFAPAI
jgi:hypothetical protein